MTEKFRFDPEPNVADTHTLMVPNTLVVYASRAVPGAVSVCMTTDDGYLNAGTRLTREQASDLARVLVSILGEEDEDPHTLAFDIGHAAGYKAGEEEGYRGGYDDGYDEGNSEGWEEGYQLGFERGIEGAEETA
jgi:flagellar assembly protein FliH